MKQSLEKRKAKEEVGVWANGPLAIEQRKRIRRLNLANIGVEISDALNINKGFLYTLIGLTLRPAETIREYLQEGRYRVLNPAKYFLLVLGIFLFVASNRGYFELPDLAQIEIQDEVLEGRNILLEMGKAYQMYFVKYFSVWSIGFIALTALFTWLFFRKGAYNYLEHVVLQTFVLMHPYWLFTVVLLLGPPVVEHGESIYFLCYFTWLTIVLKKMSGRRWIPALVQTAAALGLTLLIISIIFVSLLYLLITTLVP